MRLDVIRLHTISGLRPMGDTLVECYPFDNKENIDPLTGCLSPSTHRSHQARKPLRDITDRARPNEPKRTCSSKSTYTPLKNTQKNNKRTACAMASSGDRPCAACGLCIHPGDLQQGEARMFHKRCFRCARCNGALKSGFYASSKGKYYCKPHFSQLFPLEEIALQPPTPPSASLRILTVLHASSSSSSVGSGRGASRCSRGNFIR